MKLEHRRIFIDYLKTESINDNSENIKNMIKKLEIIRLKDIMHKPGTIFKFVGNSNTFSIAKLEHQYKPNLDVYYIINTKFMVFSKGSNINNYDENKEIQLIKEV